MAGRSNSSVPLSVVVPIKNEAANLARCLASINWANEVFVVDSQSTDGSQQIARDYGAEVVQFEFNGSWPKSLRRSALDGAGTVAPRRSRNGVERTW